MTGKPFEFQLVWAAMKKLDINMLAVEFSGEGDSGQINDVSVAYPEAPMGKDWQVAYDRQVAAFNDCDVTFPDGTVTKLAKLVEQLSDGILGYDGIPDWYNNDGGNGTIVWMLKGVTNTGHVGVEMIDLTVNQAHIEYDTTHFAYDNHGEELPTDEGGAPDTPTPEDMLSTSAKVANWLDSQKPKAKTWAEQPPAGTP
jgi:hypothetical protein